VAEEAIQQEREGCPCGDEETFGRRARSFGAPSLDETRRWRDA
jgi:hypothetical protein